jgi:hypothetical protein
LPDQRQGLDEEQVLNALTVLAANSRVYRRQLEAALPVIQRLSEDLDDVPVALLLTSITVAVAQPPGMGTPSNVEQHALAVFHELRPDHSFASG